MLVSNTMSISVVQHRSEALMQIDGGVVEAFIIKIAM